MRSIATIVAVLLCAAGGYWALQAALPPTEYPTPGELDDAEQRRPEPPQLQERPDPIEFRWTLQPPEDVMAARTAVEMGETWNATLWANIYHEDYSEIYANIPVGSLSIAALGGAASVARVSQGEAYGDAIITLVGEDNATIRALAIAWSDPACPFNRFNVFAITASAPGDSEVYYVINGYHMYEIPGQETEYVWDGPTEITAEASIVVSGLYLKCGRTSNPPDDRQLMDFTDQTGADVWYADSETTVTVTCGPCSAQGSLTYSDEEVEIGSNFALWTSMTLNSAPTAETVYARISDIKWGDTAVGGESVYLYNPGDAGDIPNGTVAPGWSRTKTTDNCARALAGSTQELCHLQGTTSSIVFSTQCWAPYILTLTPLDGKFSAEGPAYDINYTSNPVTWDSETGTYVPDVFSTPYGPIVQATLSWLYEWEWRRLSSTSIQVRVDQEWREANNENVGGETETQNDQRAGLCMWPLTAADRTSAPWWSSGFGFALASSIDINDTQGLPSRASPWTAGAGVTVDPSDNDVWTVAAGATAPAVSRSLATRYWLRLDRLSSGWTPGDEYHPDWPIMLKANLPIEVTLDDPDWWTAVPYEDITNWANRRYVLLGINAARAGTVRLTVTYSVPSVSDPCYTGAAYRWDEFSYSKTTYTRSYDVAVEAGANSKLVDLVLNREKSSVVGAYRMHIVDSIKISLPANPSGSPEAWTLTGLALVLDPGEGERDEPESHYGFRYKRPWGWIGTHWFGFGGHVDGKDALELDYGYSCQQYEIKLSSIQHSQHNPDSEAEGRLDAAKSLGRLSNELYYQEGIVPSWPSPGPEGSADNEDADEDRVDSVLYWWDIRHSTEELTISNIEVALTCGTYAIAAGVPYNLRFYKYPRGALHGIAVNPAYTVAQRNATDLIDVYQSLGGTTRVAQLATDEHGRYRFDEAYEKTALYRLDGGGELSGWLPVANREYTTATVECAQYTPVHPCLADGYLTDMHLAFCSEGTIYYRRRPSVVMPWEAATSVVTGDYPCLLIPPDNCPVMCYQTPSSTTAWLRTKDHGLTWEAVGMATSGLYPVAAEANGIQYLVTYTSGVGQVIRRSQDYFSTLLTYGAATSALVVAEGSTNAERVGFLKLDASGRMLWTAVPNSNRVYHYGSYDDGETWVAL